MQPSKKKTRIKYYKLKLNRAYLIKKTQQRALMINLVGGILLLTVTCLCGLVAYSRYYECDLLGSGRVKKSEQVNDLNSRPLKKNYNNIQTNNNLDTSVFGRGPIGPSQRTAWSLGGHYL